MTSREIYTYIRLMTADRKLRIKLDGKSLLYRSAALRDILSDSFEKFQSNGDFNQAAAIALYAILSAIPFFILTLWIAGLVFGPDSGMAGGLSDTIRKFLPYFTQEIVDQLGEIEKKKQVLGWVGVITLLWSSSLIFSAVETSFEMIFRSKSRRNILFSKMMAVALIPVGWLIGAISVALTYMASLIREYPLLAQSGWLAVAAAQGVIISHVIPYLITVLFFTLIYKIIPASRISWGNALAAGAIFSLLMEIAKHVFTWYVAGNTQYNVIYGSLQAVVILVLWVFYVALILLFCAEIISSYQRRGLILIEKAFVGTDRARRSVHERIFRKFGRVYRKDEYIFREGDTSREIYYILLGEVAVEKGMGRFRKVLTEMGPGQHFGEMAALAREPRTASIRAVQDSEIAVIDPDVFLMLLSRSEAVSTLVLREFSRRMKNTSNRLEELTGYLVAAGAIIYFFRHWPLPAGAEPIQELMRITGREEEEIRKVLGALARAGVVRYENGTVLEFDREAAWSVARKGLFPEGDRGLSEEADAASI
ncbi:MAG: YhjD/YihY/BrkB family envelope integrity protein [Syntrophales bacterium]|nr:YhjD/YihY/BrkB family envelope integrity protein [Syntrophales bacterium]MDD5531412.1 YhjD/YihY/BrkB family envelope integrity protein [Syntrophales bacterium]